MIAYSQPNVAGKDEVEREYETQLLRRSYREDRKVKNETVENLSQAGRSPGSSTRSCGYQMKSQSSGGETGTRTCHCCSPAFRTPDMVRKSLRGQRWVFASGRRTRSMPG